MKVFLNNKEICVGTRVTVMELLAWQNLHTSNVAVAVNNKVILQADWKNVSLSEGDKVTVIAAAYGG